MHNEPTSPDRPASLFLSHAHEDRPFAKRIASDLRAKGIRVWVDEMEMNVGDTLLEKITDAIAEVDYLGVVISQHSARSDWVTREVSMALTDELIGRRVKVLPFLLRGGELPEVLEGKLFADFTSEPSYASALAQVLGRLGSDTPSAPVIDRLQELITSNPLVGTVMEELRADGISLASADALLTASVDDFDLSEFLSLAVRQLEGQQLFGLAIALVPCIDRRAVGQDALDHCLEPGRLDEWQVHGVGMHMQFVTDPAAIVWCHSRLTSVIRSDVYYHSFLTSHVDVVLRECRDEMAAYLLHPNRGPGGYNLDSFEVVLQHAVHPTPFERRWNEWIINGWFDPSHGDDAEDAVVLYKLLNDNWENSTFDALVQAVEDHVHVLLKSHSEEKVRDGFYHLVAMVEARYVGAGRVLTRTVQRVYNLTPERRNVLEKLTRALQAVASHTIDPNNGELAREVNDRFREVQDADRTGITGYWRSDHST